MIDLFEDKRFNKRFKKLNCDGGGGGVGGDFGFGGIGSTGNSSGNAPGTTGSGGYANMGDMAGGWGTGLAGSSANSGTPGHSTGNFTGAATGFGQDGYGLPSEGMPGIFGGGVFGGISGLSHGEAVAGALAALNAASQNTSSDADFAGITADMTMADATAMSSGYSMGKALGQAVSEGLITADQSNATITGQNLGFFGTLAANFGSIQGGLTTGNQGQAVAGMSLLGVPMTAAFGLAALGATISGQNAIGVPAGDNANGNSPGPGFEDLVQQGQSYANQYNINMDTITNSGGSVSNIDSGQADYVTRSDAITNKYNTQADALWGDYLDFEKTYFDKFQGVQKDFKDNLASVPGLNLTVPQTMGGATIPLAPKVHSAMYSDQANTSGNLINSQGNTALSGMRSREGLNQNQFTASQAGAKNSLLPTETALDLYKMERAAQLGIDNINATANANEPSTLETWAPVVGTLLSSNGNGGTNLSSAWDFVSGLWN